jgi:RHS repeat-associated protein
MDTPIYPTYGDENLSLGASSNGIQSVILFIGHSTKEVRIISGGNLVAKELYIYTNSPAQFSLVDQTIYQRDALGHATNVYRIDAATGAIRTIYKADWSGSGPWPADLKLSETDEHGTVTLLTYDTVKRPKTATKTGCSITGFPSQLNITNRLDYDAASRVLTNATTAQEGITLKTISLFDLCGRPSLHISQEGLGTTITYASAGRIVTETYSSGTTKITQNYLDRRPRSITGTAVTNVFFDYGQNSSPRPDKYYQLWPRGITTNILASTNSSRWIATGFDTRGQPVDEIKPGFHTNVLAEKITELAHGSALQAHLYETPILQPGLPSGQLWTTRSAYDYFDQRGFDSRDGPDFYTDDLPANYLPTLSRVQHYTNYYQLDAGSWFNVAEQWTYLKDNDATPTFVSRTREKLNGFAATDISETQKFDANTNETTIKVTVGLANKKLITVTTVSQSTLSATQVVVNGLLQTESTSTVAVPTWHYYDSLARETSVKDPLGFSTGTVYDPVTGQVTATINTLGLPTLYDYYPPGGTNAGLLKSVTTPTGKKTYRNCNGRGQVIQAWGDVPYPEKRDYNDFGDLTALTTYRGGSGWSGSTWPASPGTGDTTQWLYDEPTGLLTNKLDATGHGPVYDYYNNHTLKTRVWARGIGCTNIFSPNGDLVRIDYSDSTPSVVFTNADFPYYSRRAEPNVVVDAAGTAWLTRDWADRLYSITNITGLFGGITLTNHFHHFYGRDWLQLSGISTTLLTKYGYESYGRMSSVSNGNLHADYGYLPNSDLLATTTSKNGDTPVLVTTRNWEYGHRLRSISNIVSGVNLASFDYLYDDNERRTQTTLEDGSRWQYGYNDRDELGSAKHFWPDWSPVAGQQFTYNFDNIGNRTSASSGGDANGDNLRPTTYVANSLNQYTTITNLGYQQIIGLAYATNSVTVNGNGTDRHGEYFHNEMGVGNSSGPVWTNADIACGTVSNVGGLIIPKASQSLTYDLDGNLTFDGIWTYEWDGENRLTSMTMTNIVNVPDSKRLRLEFKYDFQGRRIEKKVSHWNSGSWLQDSDSFFVYDSWNLIAILNSPSSILASFNWGQDLSGTMDKAGGIGGLLLISLYGSAATNCFLAYDGAGNVGVLMNTADNSTCARYEYSPFGETLRLTGPLANANGFRFSTKFADDETGLLYYSHRYCKPAFGRWATRDPSGEQGGLNLYSLTANGPTDKVDRDGLDTYLCNRQKSYFGRHSRSRSNPFTHTFIFITDENGMVVGTFGWGEDSILHGSWQPDSDIDMDAAREALSKGQAERVGDAAFDSYVRAVFRSKFQNAKGHMNFLLFLSCKSEAGNLVNQARIEQEIQEDEDYGAGF